MTVRGITPQALADLFSARMRIAPASVSLVTARGADGGRVPPRSIGGKGQGSVGSAGDLSSQICTAEVAHDYGTHTIFVGRRHGA
jgi:hypothetical protein